MPPQRLTSSKAWYDLPEDSQARVALGGLWLMWTNIVGGAIVLLGLLTLLFVWWAHRGDPRLWGWVIRRYERRDKKHPPAPGGVVLTGSSSIWLWKTMAADLAPVRVLNRGFGGSRVDHITHYLDRVVLPYRPSVVVLYSGDNDLAGTLGPQLGPDAIADAYTTLLARLDETLPDVPIVLLTIKPSPSREALWPLAIRTNGLLADLAAKHDRVHFLNVSTPLLDEGGRPNRGYFGSDRLHMNEAGYAVWSERLRPLLLSLTGASDDDPPA